MFLALTKCCYTKIMGNWNQRLVSVFLSSLNQCCNYSQVYSIDELPHTLSVATNNLMPKRLLSFLFILVTLNSFFNYILFFAEANNQTKLTTSNRNQHSKSAGIVVTVKISFISHLYNVHLYHHNSYSR